ncbi:exo-alpha-sialidase [Helicobacter felis]|uniref:Neuraminidase n=2 Tax=Helicobacter felis TaxID=214 RepID=E7ACH2_HELFC|nr:sialidase family protein [Helicobacter felis]CBY82201.1 neuraminidase [Helicobacter felis ATCC 49179]
MRSAFLALFLICLFALPGFAHPLDLFKKQPIPPPPVQSVHSANLGALPSGHLLVVYFGGSEEGLPDVCIYGNLYDPKTKVWSPAFKLLSPTQLSTLSKSYIETLGNPVLAILDHKVYLFVVGVSLGGWATSRIYTLQADLPSLLTQKPHLHFISTLSLSPLLNISHLVRNAPLPTEDGGFILPIYHELATKFPLLLKFDSKARLQRVIKPNHLTSQLQPTLVPYQQCALMAFRSSKDTHLYTQTCKDLLHWNPPIPSNLHNYDDALALFNANHETYLVYNAPLPNASSSRSSLRLARFAPTSKRSSYFDPLAILDQSLEGEVSYPSVLVLQDTIHLVYTRHRRTIMHLTLNQALLKAL